MKRDIDRLKAERFDILVIGGGINGCATARDAALRGARTALIEKDDFASGASGKTTKLIHGGIRYLEQLNFKLVYEALRERAILLKTAPHIVKPLEFIIPVYKGDPRSLSKIKAGTFIYDLLAGKENIHRHRSLKRTEITALEGKIESRNLKGGVLYYDAQVDDIRLCLDNAVSAYEAGCCVANKVEAAGFVKENGKITGAQARDKLTGEIFLVRANVAVNTTGAWSNAIVQMDDRNARQITRPTKGIHIIYRKLPHERAILISARKDKRVFFAIPWRGTTLIGTTDTDYSGSPDEVYATPGEIEYLLEETRRIFPAEKIDKKGIITTYAALRPLVNSQGRLPWQVSREHSIEESRSGLISLVGGKYTTYRHLAEEVVDAALSKLGRRDFKRCVTATTGPPPAVREPCTNTVQGEPERLDLRGAIEYAVKEEMANALADLLVRRLQFSTSPSLGLDRLEECAKIMAELLNWPQAQKESQIRLYKNIYAIE